jgi:spermidine synthase
VYRIRGRVPSHAALLERAAERDMVFYRDGIDATIAVQDLGSRRMLVINGKVDASTGDDLYTQKFLAHVPALLHPHPRSVLVVGLGSGATVGSLLTHPDVEHVDVVELSAEVIVASRLFESINHRYWEDPRVHVHREDAKTFLQVTPHRYDLIISEPTNPWIAGVAGVFSEEFFDACLTRLQPGGLFTQWFHSYELEDESALMILETFASRFPYHSIWNPLITDILLVGAPEPHAPSIERFVERSRVPSVSEDFAQLNWPSAVPLLFTQMANHMETRNDAPILGARNSDVFPVLEYNAPRGFFVGSTARVMNRFDQRGLPPARASLLLHDLLATQPLTEAEWQAVHTYGRDIQSMFPGFTQAVTNAWSLAHPDSSRAREALIAAQSPEWAIPLDQTLSPETQRLILSRLLDQHHRQLNWLNAPDTSELEERLLSLLQQPAFAEDPQLHLWRGNLARDRGDFGEASRHHLQALTHLEAQENPNPDLRKRIGIALCETALNLGSPVVAQELYDQLLSSLPEDLDLLVLRAKIQNHTRS